MECVKNNVLIEIEALLPGFADLLWWRIGNFHLLKINSYKDNAGDFS